MEEDRGMRDFISSTGHGEELWGQQLLSWLALNMHERLCLGLTTCDNYGVELELLGNYIQEEIITTGC